MATKSILQLNFYTLGRIVHRLNNQFLNAEDNHEYSCTVTNTVRSHEGRTNGEEAKQLNSVTPRPVSQP